MKQNDRVQAVVGAKDPLEAFSRAKGLTLGDFIEEPVASPGQPGSVSMIRCEDAAREATVGFCEKYNLDRLQVLQAVATTVARLTAVELTCPEDVEAEL